MSDAPKSDAPKSDAPQSDAPQSDAPQSDAPASDAEGVTEDATPKTVEADSYANLDAEVAAQFQGDWEQFFKAVQNPVEIMQFVLFNKCDGEPQKFEAWAKEKTLPPDWAGRFFSALTSEGEVKT